MSCDSSICKLPSSAGFLQKLLCVQSMLGLAMSMWSNALIFWSLTYNSALMQQQRQPRNIQKDVYIMGHMVRLLRPTTAFHLHRNAFNCFLSLSPIKQHICFPINYYIIIKHPSYQRYIEPLNWTILIDNSLSNIQLQS